jgi:hypothetical protein
MTTKSISPGLLSLVVVGMVMSLGSSAMAISTTGGQPGRHANRQAKHHGKNAPAPTSADAFKALGTAGPANWTVLEVGSGTITQQADPSNPQAAIQGNVGVAQKGKFMGSPLIHGDMYLGNNSSTTVSGTGTVSGMVHLAKGATAPSTSFTTMNDSQAQSRLNQARSDAIAASSTAHSLASTSSLTSLNLANTSMTLTSGVYGLSSLNLDHTTLTLSGSGYFVFNITSSFTLNSAKVLLANGASESNILFNYTGTTPLTVSGGANGSADQSVLHGILLALNAKVNLSPGLVVGEIISGQNISLGAGSSVQQATTNGVTTVPDRASTFGLSLIAFSGIVAFRAFVLRTSARRVRSAS